VLTSSVLDITVNADGLNFMISTQERFIHSYHLSYNLWRFIFLPPTLFLRSIKDYTEYSIPVSYKFVEVLLLAAKKSLHGAMLKPSLQSERIRYRPADFKYNLSLTIHEAVWCLHKGCARFGFNFQILRCLDFLAYMNQFGKKHIWITEFSSCFLCGDRFRFYRPNHHLSLLCNVSYFLPDQLAWTRPLRILAKAAGAGTEGVDRLLRWCSAAATKDVGGQRWQCGGARACGTVRRQGGVEHFKTIFNRISHLRRLANFRRLKHFSEHFMSYR
jgi:hypothetical protein